MRPQVFCGFAGFSVVVRQMPMDFA